jgi:hypothetical protein
VGQQQENLPVDLFHAVTVAAVPVARTALRAPDAARAALAT